MLQTREDIEKYAIRICLSMLERTANRRVMRTVPTVIDQLGYVPTFLEEFCRPFWGIAPILRERKSDFILNIQGKPVKLCDWAQEVLIEGTNPKSPYSWDTYRSCVGEHSFAFQNLTELAGLLIGMYFAREKLWDPIPKHDKIRIAEWIHTCCVCECSHMAGNNHIWFPLFCLLVLKRFGFVYPDTDRFLREGLDKLDTMYISDGWYQDGKFGRFDYYIAWSMHSYPLIWCLLENESFDGYSERRKEYINRTERFLSDYIYWFDADGAHVPFGRSLVYRFAASCVFPLAVLCGCKTDPALAKTVTVRNISYFAEHPLLIDSDILPAGYTYESPALVENYTSDGGAYWCAKTFLCLLIPENHRFWQSETVELPIEKGDYLVEQSADCVHMMIGGTKESGVTVYNNVFQYYQDGRYYNPFNDMAAYYNKFAYNSRAGFALSTRDRTGYDNMIGIQTEDGSMNSHRWGFIDCGKKDGMLLSVHTPFANDTDTCIRTVLIPLRNGYHIRLHRVTLSQPYRITEGGFCVGFTDDFRKINRTSNGISVRGHKLISVLQAVGTVTLEFKHMSPQPGMYLLAPHCGYPGYNTAVLSAGTYCFATVCGVFDAESDMETKCPTVFVNGQEFTVKTPDREQHIPFSVFDFPLN